MNKLKLDVDTLQVQSFATRVADRPETAAQADVMATANTCYRTCYHTCLAC
jgi:hypothetical protein